MSSNESARRIETGRQGGHASTVGRPWQEAQKIDADINKGRRDAKR